jgi:small subunit ribosomal protein S7
MPRRKKTEFIREIGVDARFESAVIQKMINVIMWRGKKNAARTIVYDAIDILIKKSSGDEKKALDLFNKALNQAMPFVEVRPRRVGGSVYQIPMEVDPKRRLSLALRWIIQSAKSRSGRTMGQRLAAELLEAYEGKGGAIKKRAEVQRLAEANRAFSHFAW